MHKQAQVLEREVQSKALYMLGDVAAAAMDPESGAHTELTIVTEAAATVKKQHARAVADATAQLMPGVVRSRP
jgi:hypothetical protein